MKSVSKNELVKKLSICGQVAEHKSEKMQENGVDEEAIMSVLSEEEKNTLDTILTKLQADWLEGHKAYHTRK